MMAHCKRCGRSGLLFRTNAQGLCKSCDEEARAKIQAQRDRIKEALIAVRCLKSPQDKILQLRRAMDSAQVLSTYERLGYGTIEPSPAALAALLEEKLQEARAEQEAAGTRCLGDREARSQAIQGELRPEGAAEARDPSQTAKVNGEMRWDRRRAMRRRTELLVRIDPGGSRALAEDVSRSGLRVHAAQLRRPGSRVRIILSTPKGPVPAEGIVRWARASLPGSKGQRRAAMGLELPDLPPELQAFLLKS